MNAATIALIAQYAIKFGIPAAQALVKMFQTPNPTQADWDNLFKLSEKPLYDADVQSKVDLALSGASASPKSA